MPKEEVVECVALLLCGVVWGCVSVCVSVCEWLWLWAAALAGFFIHFFHNEKRLLSIIFPPACFVQPFERATIQLTLQQS